MGSSSAGWRPPWDVKSEEPHPEFKKARPSHFSSPQNTNQGLWQGSQHTTGQYRVVGHIGPKLRHKSQGKGHQQKVEELVNMTKIFPELKQQRYRPTQPLDHSVLYSEAVWVPCWIPAQYRPMQPRQLNSLW
jgi:hypothetical protein